MSAEGPKGISLTVSNSEEKPCGDSLLSYLAYLCRCKQTDRSLPLLKELMGIMAQEWDRGDLFLYQPKKCFNVKRTSWVCTWLRQALDWNKAF